MWDPPSPWDQGTAVTPLGAWDLSRGLITAVHSCSRKCAASGVGPRMPKTYGPQREEGIQ